MAKFYTNISQVKNNIQVIGYDNGVRFNKKIEYKPFLFVNSKNESKYKTIKGESVSRMDFDSIREQKDFIKEYSGVDGFEIYGLEKPLYTYIYEEYKSGRDIEYDVSMLSTGFIDIEVSIKDGKGFPDIQKAENEVTLITIAKNDKFWVYGCGSYINEDPRVTYIRCSNEIELLNRFLRKWEELQLDIITGWNVEFFDIPYLVNRIRRVLTDDAAKKLSPWGLLQERNVEFKGKENQVFIPLGITTLDYYQLYIKFGNAIQESYKLDYIANAELGIGKVDFDGSLAELENDWQKYVEYNIRDVDLVMRLDNKMRLIELVLAMAYDAGVTYQDTFTTVNLWDVIIHNYLLDHNTVVPPFKRGSTDRTIAGGYVKEPQAGKHKWVLSFDLTSLYPHLIMQYNISPETLVGMFPRKFDVDDVINGFFKKDENIAVLINNDVTVTGNMAMFKRDKQGFLPAIMSKMFNDRKAFNKLKQEAETNLEKADTEELKEKFRIVVSQYDKKQQAKKIQLNAGYGALANPYFRWFMELLAEGITLSGQLSTKWIEGHINDFCNRLFKTKSIDYVIAADTDSIYLKADGFIDIMPEGRNSVDWLDEISKKAIAPFIENKYKELADMINAFEQKMFMKRECIAEGGIFVAKKKYVLNVWDKEGVRYAEPKLKIMGLEAIRTSTPQICRGAIKQVMKLALSGTEPEVQKYIADFKKEFFKKSFVEVAFPRGVSDIEKWKDGRQLYKSGTPIHVKGAIIYNNMLKEKNLLNKYELITNGTKIKFSYLKKPNPAFDSVISCPEDLPGELNLDKYVDYDMQFQKTFIQPVTNLIEKAGWTVEARNSIEDFFA